MSGWGKIIAEVGETARESGATILSLVFAEGQRPGADSLAAFAATRPPECPFAISHRPDVAHDRGGADWVELLAAGLTFDCHGLAPGEAANPPAADSLFGLDAAPRGQGIALGPGPHIAAGRALMPAVRTLAALGAALAGLPGVLALCWEPAASWIEPQYYRRIIADWLAGGAFPALGLTSLKREANGAMVSRGLAFLIGQELRFEPDPALAPGDAARIALRIMHELVVGGALTESRELTGPDGERLLAVPVLEGAQLRVMLLR